MVLVTLLASVVWAMLLASVTHFAFAVLETLLASGESFLQPKQRVLH